MAKSDLYRDYTKSKHTGLGNWPCRIEHRPRMAIQRFHALDTRRDMAEERIVIGLTIWLMYWLFQEWFIYNTLLGEPFILNLLELTILILGSLVEGVVIAFFLARNSSGMRSK